MNGNGDNNGKRRWVPWSREADEKAKYWGTVLGLLSAVVAGGTGYLRVDKFGLSDYLTGVTHERLITNSSISKLKRELEVRCNKDKQEVFHRLALIEKADSVLIESVRIIRNDLAALNEKVDYFQRKYWESKTRNGNGHTHTKKE